MKVLWPPPLSFSPPGWEANPHLVEVSKLTFLALALRWPICYQLS